jgi:chemotaxis protein methyltransferase CheR
MRMIKLTDKEFTYMVSYVKSNFGIDLSKKRVLLEGRLGQYLADQGYTEFTSYIKALEADKSGKELTNLLNKVTTNHTYFMREANHFDFLRDTVLPQLERSVTGRDLRVWCAASSSGEEPYTLAMILNDHFARKVPAWDKALLATDISQKVLDEAKEGIYPLESIKDVPEKWKRSYFKKYDDENVHRRGTPSRQDWRGRRRAPAPASVAPEESG